MTPKKSGGTFVSPAMIQNYLAGIDYPAEKDDLIQYASDQDAPDDMISLLRQIPSRTYNKTSEVIAEVDKLE